MYRNLCFLTLFSALQLFGQVTTATLYTIVADPSGAAIGRVTVVLKNDATGAVRQQTCDDVGECSFTFLAPGSYTASISAPGFKTLEVSAFQIDAAQNIRRKF